MDSQIIAFAFAAAALTIAPGPDNMLVIRNVIRGGRRDGLVTGLAIGAGLFVHATLSALGISAILLHSATAFHTLKIIGAAYLVFLGLQSLRAATRRLPAAAPVAQFADASLAATDADSSLPVFPSAADPAPSHADLLPAGSLRSLREGFLSNVLNPKTAVFYLALLPQFIRPDDPVLARSLILAGIHYAESMLWFVALVFLLDRLKRWFMGSAVRRWMDGLCGALLLAFGVRLAFARR